MAKAETGGSPGVELPQGHTLAQSRRRPVSFDDFEVDLERRELRRRGRTVPLQEKPFQLLEVLLASPGQTVSREELTRRLWPDERFLDFDASLNVAVRKLRHALGDSAEDPRWLETLPRQGYRWKTAPSVVSRRGRSAFVWLVALLSVLGVAGAWLGRVRTAPPAPESSVRLGIMPFELASESGDDSELARLSEWLVATLARDGRGRVEVVGPRSTAPYSSFPFPDLGALISELELDYVLNARVLVDDGERALLVELIRLDDGSHPWVEFFPEPTVWEATAQRVRLGVAEGLGLGE